MADYTSSESDEERTLHGDAAAFRYEPEYTAAELALMGDTYSQTFSLFSLPVITSSLR